MLRFIAYRQVQEKNVGDVKLILFCYIYYEKLKTLDCLVEQTVLLYFYSLALGLNSLVGCLARL